jgi:hypothetical protein
MAAKRTVPGAQRPSDLEEIFGVSTTGVAGSGDLVPMKSALCRVSRVRGHRLATLPKSALVRREPH